MLEYIAIPYSSGDASEELMTYRAKISDFIFSELAKEGRILYAPISSCHHIAVKYGLPRDWQFWKTMDEVFLEKVDKLVVVMLEGWDTSTGLKAELEIAEERGIEIEYIDPTPYLEKLKALENGEN
jgi:hypothetical protein